MVKKFGSLKTSAKEKAHDATAVLKAQVSANIKIFRKRAGLTQEQLAKKTKVSARYIAELERQTGQNATLDTLGRLADALFIKVSDLINGPQPMAKRKIDSIRVAIESLNHYCKMLESVEDIEADLTKKSVSDDPAHHDQSPVEGIKKHRSSKRK